MKKKHFRFLSLAFFLVGIFFLLNSKTDITGAVVGVSNISSGISSIFGIVFILVSAMLFVGGESLEERVESAASYERLKKSLRRREQYGESFFSEILRSDLNRIRKFPENTWKDYNPNLSFQENQKRLMRAFHSDNPNPGLEINDEIREGYRKSLDLSPEEFYGKGQPKEIQKRVWKNTKRKLLNSSEFYRFKKNAIKEIQRLDIEALNNKIVPILETRPNPSVDYRGFKSKIVYFGPEELFEKYKPHQIEELESEHLGKDVFKYHLIYNPADVKKGKIPHGHWELEYLGKNHSNP
tara:strand:- start:624 stop:1511 length:888 start_codon:yes stop_codon:yes gene_type:complete